MRLDSIIALTFVVAMAAQAQDDGGRGPGRGRFRGPNVGFTTLDLNHDGSLDASEIDAAAKSLLKLDKNADGQITADEVRMALPMGRGRGGPGGGEHRGGEGGAETNMAEETVKTLMAFDANGDGKLTKEELPERFQGLLAKGDENKDGFLTPEEIRKMVAAQAPPPERMGGGGRGGPDGERGEGRRGGEMNFIRFDPILAAIDTNGDGVLSAEELRQATASLKKLDKDGDGTISREEAAPTMPPPPPPREDRF